MLVCEILNDDISPKSWIYKTFDASCSLGAMLVARSKVLIISFLAIYYTEQSTPKINMLECATFLVTY